MTTMLQVPRTRGAVSGVLLVLLGAWGALIPFVGPYFHYAYTPDAAWTYTTGRLWMEIVPGAATVVGGIILLSTATRPVAMFGAELAAVAGAWFALGTILTPIWTTTSALNPGFPVGGTIGQPLEQIGFFTGLGVVIVFIGALALGRLTVIGVRDRRPAETVAEAERERTAETEAATAPVQASSAGVRNFGRWLVARRS
jgi:hypothetical protein